MPAPAGSTIDATALSPTRRQRVSIMSGLTNGVRRISAAFGGSRAPTSTSTDPVAVDARPPTAGTSTSVVQGRPTTAGTVASWISDRIPASPAGRTRASTDSTTSTTVVCAGETDIAEGPEVARQDDSSSWALAGSERPPSRFSQASDDFSVRPGSGCTTVAPMMAPSRNMPNSAGAGAGGRSAGRRKSSVHYRVGGGAPKM
jgi:hypothetical protein